jgi:hypothetical protein
MTNESITVVHDINKHMVHRDDARRTPAGTPLPDGDQRTYSLIGDVRRIVDRCGDRMEYQADGSWRVQRGNGEWVEGALAVAILRSWVMDLHVQHLIEVRDYKLVGRHDASRDAVKWATKSLNRPSDVVLRELCSDPRILVIREKEEGA